ncbi:hypothetical protein [Wolbachia endosymbiont (group A) of Cheilosia soror]|nr:hypothetical protein [Wolbachia endosymbiont (group A) of Cheilosia soror]
MSTLPSKDGLPLGLSSQQCWARSIREEEKAQEKANRYLHRRKRKL